MTYINKQTRLFLDINNKDGISATRSEARLKNYASTFDLRTWCHFVEQRRQQILEYQARVRTGKCPEKSVIPTEVMIQFLMSNQNKTIQRLERKIEYFDEVAKMYEGLLTKEQKSSAASKKKSLSDKYGIGDDDQICAGPCTTGTQTLSIFEKCDDKCNCHVSEILCGIITCVTAKHAKKVSSKDKGKKQGSDLKSCVCNDEQDGKGGKKQDKLKKPSPPSAPPSREQCECEKGSSSSTKKPEKPKQEKSCNCPSDKEAKISQTSTMECLCHLNRKDSSYVCKGPCGCSF